MAAPRRPEALAVMPSEPSESLMMPYATTRLARPRNASPVTLPLALVALGASAASAASAAAQEPERGWTFSSELSVVVSEGNSESLTLGLGVNMRRAWTRTTVTFEGRGVRSDASRKTRTAVGSAESFVITEEKVREKTAEALNLRARVDRQVSDGVFAFAGLDWLRNTFAGVDGRYLVATGGGKTWVDDDRTRFKTDLAGTYTFQSDVVDNPFVKRTFPGVRSGVALWKKVSGSAEAESELVTDWNVDETSDVRMDWTSSLAVSITEVVALKPSLQLLWRNRPSLTSVKLFTADGTDTGERVNVPLEKLDLFFRVAVAVTL